MAIHVTRPPLKSGEGKTIFFFHAELTRMDDILCQYVYESPDVVRWNVPLETQQLVFHIIDKINRHI